MLYDVLLRKCASAGETLQPQYRAGFKAGVGGGGVHYAWPPTHYCIHIYIEQMQFKLEEVCDHILCM